MSILRLPSLTVGKVSNSELALAKSRMGKAEETFANQISQAIRFTGVPIQILMPFMYMESECVNVRNRNTSATGLMQIMPETAVDIICMSKRMLIAKPDAKAALIKILGAKRVNGYTVPLMDGSTAINRYGGITRSDLDNTELNVLLGAMILAYLLRTNIKSNGEIDIERVIVKYNQGIGTKLIGSTPAQVLSYTKIRFGAEPANYILKMSGKNGFLSAYA